MRRCMYIDYLKQATKDSLEKKSQRKIKTLQNMWKQ